MEQLRQREEIPELIEVAIEASQELYEEMKEKRQAVVDEYDVEIDNEPEHGYAVELDRLTYVVTYPDEILEVEEDGEWMSPSDVEVPEEIHEFVTKYWKAWDGMRNKMLNRMEEIGLKHLHTAEYYHTYRAGEFGPEVVVRGAFLRRQTQFSIKARTEDWWELHQVWERFDDPADDSGQKSQAEGDT